MTASAALLPCSILILAGGRGQRMGGRDKGLVEWRGKPLIEHIHDVARPLTDDLIISCNRNAERYTRYADHLVSDPQDDFPGPLAGIIAGLRQARHAHVLILPCDAPLIDRSLLMDMLRRAAECGEKPLMLRQGGQWEPLFSVVPKTSLGLLEEAWAVGERSPRRALLECDIQALDYPGNDRRLANLNSQELLNGIS
ncbi:molybdenum cofactor guanylyltransferase MobA [Pseudomonas sp. LRF_L74]|uniref:molybdenum cofactor guanylyltransferase MobA n=1 Tax=Pseudomonas sp. LRF_L74 TaxID=3369422 RepID=UPI003F623F8D